ncbi:MAG: hypothetical protein CMF69_03035 [Magnetovibrio sp.]|nr:hypothetical protein [Magnetovibrio sp.]
MKNRVIFHICNIILYYMSTLEDFKKKLAVFLILKKGDKLMKNDDLLYHEPPSLLQSFKRWWYSENQETTFEYLDSEFKHFMKFLNKVEKKDSEQVKQFMNDIIPGIHSLKLTYPHCRKICCKVDSIILTFLDFKK